MSDVARRLAHVRGVIAAACHRAGRSPAEVKVMAVTKTQPASAVEEAIVAGVDAIGENRVQEAASKRPLVRLSASWHLIGTLQRNKAKKALELFDLIATVDRVPLAQALERLLAAQHRVMPVMLEVNVGREAQKGGVLPEELPRLVEFLLASCPHLLLCGLLTVPPYHPNPEACRPHFRTLRRLRDQLCQEWGLSTLELSMGMSEDYAVAVEEGATWVRLGRVLFGPKQTP